MRRDLGDKFLDRFLFPCLNLGFTVHRQNQRDFRKKVFPDRFLSRRGKPRVCGEKGFDCVFGDGGVRDDVELGEEGDEVVVGLLYPAL
jgi:hypothetical protein